MMNSFRDFVQDERSQNILEYTVLMGLVVVLGVVVFHGVGSGMRIWAIGNSVLGAANTAAG